MFAALPRSPGHDTTVAHDVARPEVAASRDYQEQDGGARGNPPIYDYCDYGYELADVDESYINLCDNGLCVGNYANVC